MSKTLIYGEIVRAQLENASANLTPVATGLLYYNTTSNEARIYNGTTWKSVLYSDFANASGSLPIANGGTGAATALAAFNALSPLTTKGDLLSRSTTDNVRVGVGIDGQVLTADSATASGLAWKDGGAGGSGEINCILNPSAASNFAGWEVGTNHGVDRITSGSPLAPVITTALRFSNTGTATESATSGVRDEFTLPDSLKNRKLKVQFAVRAPSSTTWAVSVYDGTTRLSLSTDAPTATTIPAGFVGTFTTYFDSTSNSAYRINFTATAGANSDLDVTNVIVGPGIQAQGAAVGNEPTYSPASQGFGTPTFDYVSVSRDGTKATFSARFTTGTATATEARFNFPAGMTASVPGGVSAIAGTWRVNNSGASTLKSGSIIVANGHNYVGFSNDDYTTAGAPSTRQNGTFIGSSVIVWVDFEIQVAEWSGNGTVALAQNDVQYVWNSSTSTTTSDTSSFGYGQSGALIQSISSAGNWVERTVRLPTAIQSGSLPVVEVSPDNVQWIEAEELVPGLEAGTSKYGISVRPDNTTPGVTNRNQFIVRFGGNGATGTQAWSVTPSGFTNPYSGWYWRVRYIQDGVAVGVGAATATTLGLVSGGRVPGSLGTAAIVAGNVGETLSATPTSQTASGFNSTASIASVSLTPGVWLLTACGSGQNGTRPTTGISAIGWDIYNLTTTTVLVRQRFTSGWNSSSADTDSGYATAALACTLVTSSSATIQFRVRCDEAAAGTGTPTAASFAEGLLQAVRIA